jgi:hypothetical protein
MRRPLAILRIAQLIAAKQPFASFSSGSINTNIHRDITLTLTSQRLRICLVLGDVTNLMFAPTSKQDGSLKTVPSDCDVGSSLPNN